MRIPRFLLFLLLCAFTHTSQAQAQTRATVSGYVQDAETGEKLIGCRVFDPVMKAGAISNNYGFYSITLTTDTLRLVCNFPGYKNWQTAFVMRDDTLLTINLQPLGSEIGTIEITAEQSVQDNSQMSVINVPVETIKNIPMLMGEVDVMRALQLLPGVHSQEGSTGIYVRGGGPDQNLILLDGVPVYNVSHLFGFFSLFNADALRNVTLIKGGFPARYGGRLSSVVDISMKEGNLNEIHGEGTIGLVASKFTLEGPIKKGKTSFLVSARRTYIDVLARPLIKASLSQGDNSGSAGLYFYDLNGKINHVFNDKDRLYLSVYNGRDRIYARTSFTNEFDNTTFTNENEFSISWGNTIAALRWNHLFSEKLFGNLTATYSRYNFVVDAFDKTVETTAGNTQTNVFKAAYVSAIRDWSAKLDFDWYASPNHLVRFGGYATLHRFTPGVTQLAFETDVVNLDTTFGGIVTDAVEAAAYIEDDFKIGSRIKVNPGLHASAFWVNGEFYRSIQPRFSGRMLLSPNWSVKASWANMYQFIHLLSNSNVGLPTDLWVPATDRVRPQRSWQAAAGIARTIPKLNLELTVEGYYKEMQDIIEYKEGASFIGFEPDWQDQVERGHSWSYGTEVLLQRTKGKTTGWIGYTLSWTWRQFDNINHGLKYPAKYDRRHDVSVVLNHKFSKKVDAGFTWVFGTGSAITMPVAQYSGGQPSILDNFYLVTPLQFFDQKNNFRMRDYHRLDVGVNLHKEKKHYTRTWSFSIYNTYNRLNPYFVFFQDQGDKLLAKQFSLFPLIPSVAFKIDF